MTKQDKRVAECVKGFQRKQTARFVSLGTHAKDYEWDAKMHKAVYVASQDEKDAAQLRAFVCTMGSEPLYELPREARRQWTYNPRLKVFRGVTLEQLA